MIINQSKEIFFSFFLLSMLLFGCSEKTVLDKVYDSIREESDTIKLADFTDFEWDRVLITSPHVKGGNLSVLEGINVDISNIKNVSTNREDTTEWSGIVYFIHNNKVVYVDCVPWIKKSRIDVWNSFDFDLPPKHYIILSKEDAIFINKSQHLYPIIYLEEKN